MTSSKPKGVVASSDIYYAVASWGQRAEAAEALASRWMALIARLQELDPLFERCSH